MYGPFEYLTRTRIVFGPGRAASVGKDVQQMGGRRVLIVTDKGIERAGLLDKVVRPLMSDGIDFDVFSNVEPNPRSETMDRAAAQARELIPDVIIGFGGGSSLDTAKGAALLATNGGRMTEYHGKDKVKVTPLPVIAIPTTAGTGSEVTGNIAFTDTAKRDKLSSRSPLNMPPLAILDPTLLSSLPAPVAAATGVDALTHAVEGYLSRQSNPVTDTIALEAVRMIGRSLRTFVTFPDNPEAAGEMLLASCLAGMVITNTGTGNVHGIARPLGGMFDLPHGVLCAVMFCPVLEFNLPARPEKMKQVAIALGEQVEHLPPMEAGRAAVKAVASLCDDVGIKRSLQALGVPREALPQVAELSVANTGPNPRRTTLDDLNALLQAAY